MPQRGQGSNTAWLFGSVWPQYYEPLEVSAAELGRWLPLRSGDTHGSLVMCVTHMGEFHARPARLDTAAVPAEPTGLSGQGHASEHQPGV